MIELEKGPESRRQRSRAGAFTCIAAGSAGAFLLLARAVSRRDTATVDRKVLRKVKLRADEPLRRIAAAISPMGKWWIYVPAAGAIAGYLVISARESADRSAAQRLAGGGAVVGAAIFAACLNNVLDDLPQPPAPPGRPSRHPVFPSGHTFGTASVGLTAAWVLSREELMSGWLSFPVALLLTSVSAGAKMIEGKHWLSDIAGGVLVASTVASTSLAVYELVISSRTTPVAVTGRGRGSFAPLRMTL